MNNAEEQKCRTCGKPMPEKSGAGRKPDFCDTPCANYQKYRDAMVRSLDIINLSTESNKEVRADMFRLCNELRSRETNCEAQAQ